ncbi:serine hydrolase domain-containing protein [Gaetbulibacter jejuensis]|uniref:Serine hydrolase domain-containing protein n=1 Tax=Gaetbulibacter jejuensis TaxID=584607 RepID=A0ABP3UX53_9FLAO
MKNLLTKRISSLILFLFLFQVSFSQKIEKQIDSLLSTVYNDSNGPGGVFLVSKKGETIYRKATGKSNIELDVDMTPENVFQIGSMTKQFTAIAIMMLQEEGKLNVSDTISKYLQDYPNGNSITIHHLLTHTSGIKDFTKMKLIMSIAKSDLKPKALIDFFKNEPSDFLSGEKFKYNNSGYTLLGYIIELVSNQDYKSFIEEQIFNKIGMNHSYYASDSKIIKNRAYGYHGGKAYKNKFDVSFTIPYASGALMSTVDDMLLWQQAINNNILISQETKEIVFMNHSLNDGTKINYGYGWHLKEINSVKTREHGGSIFGFKSMAVYVPDLDIYVVGFSNCDCNSPTVLVREIASVIIKDNEKNK